MRIIGGEFKGRGLFAPAGLETRPTADKVKEALFNIVRDRIPGAVVLDLFSGSGALGLEALSRGAARAILVDSHPQALAAMTRNAAPLALGERLVIIKADLTRPVKSLAGTKADLVFLDPPYGLELAEKALKIALRHDWITSGGLAVIEHSRKENPRPQGLVLTGERRYGRTSLSFFELEPDQNEAASPD
ncbi:MAG: 16S rRNA (guanine(966)-N(2))-methyltransferase RsmD [Pseudomonadota bacterium]